MNVNAYSYLENYGGSLYYYIFELANFSFVAFIIIFAYHIRLINSLSLTIWLLLALLPLFLNYFLLSPHTFPDQFEYFHETTSLQSTGNSTDRLIETKRLGGGISEITFASKIFGAVPLPNFMTVTSIAFVNKLMSFALFVWLARFIKEEKLIFFFLVPSFVLYSSLSLRDSLVIILAIVSLINFVNLKNIFGLLFLTPLYFLKIQLFLFLAVYFVGRTLFKAHKSMAGMVTFFGLGLGAAFAAQEFLLLWLNYYRIGFIAENMAGGYKMWGRFGDASLYYLDTLFEVFFVTLTKLPEFLLMPLPWDWGNPLYIVQCFESIALIYGLYYISQNYKVARNQEFIFLFSVLLLGLSFYAFLSQNVGTFVRYRFSLFLPFLITMYYVATRDSVKSKT